MTELPTLASVLQENVHVFDDVDYDTPESKKGDQEPSEKESPVEAGTDIESHEQLRDDKGRFTKAPSSWKAEAKAKWEGLDPDIQQEVDRREQDFHRGLEDYKDRASRYDDFERAVSPYMATIQSLGMEPTQAVGNLLAVDHALRYGSTQQKLSLLSNLAQSYNIDLSPLLQRDQDQPYVDPEVVKVRQELAQLQQTLQQRDLHAQQTQQAELQAQFNNFASDPKNEHFEKVRGDMAALLRAGKAQDLQEAYDQALWLNPDTRIILLAQQQEQAKSDQVKKAQGARKAASVNIPKRGTLPAGQKTGTLRETLESVAREQGLL